MTALPVADPWYQVTRLDERITLITEPRVHPIFSANIHLVEGAARDLLIDAGMGVAPLAPVVQAARRDPDKPLTLLLTHTHVDHVGAAHEFPERLVHPAEADALATPEAWTLRSADIPDPFPKIFLEAGYPPLWEHLVDAVPEPAFDADGWRLRPAPATGAVAEGDVIDLGDWQAEVLALPGHSPGQVGLFHRDSGTLFGADAIYDGPLIWNGPGMSVADYAATLRRVRALPVARVLGGHDPAFGRARLEAICAHYLGLWEGSGRA